MCHISQHQSLGTKLLRKGKEWLTQYISNVSVSQDKILFRDNVFRFNHIYRFRDPREKNRIISLKYLLSLEVEIDTDVVDNDIPLLFSRSMKRANLKVNFKDDTINIFNEVIPLLANSGHYTIPMTKAKKFISNVERDTDMRITPIKLDSVINKSLSDSKDDHDIVLKIFRQFAHTCQEKLLQLIKNAGKPWRNNQNLKEEIKNVSGNCSTCKRYKKNTTFTRSCFIHYYRISGNCSYRL